MKINPFSFSQKQTLKQRIRIWLGGIILVLGLLIIISFYFIEKNDRETEIREQLNQTIALQSLFIERWTEERAKDIEQIAASEEAKQLDMNRLANVFKHYNQSNSDYWSIFIVNKDGYIVSDLHEYAWTYVGDREYFKEAKNHRSSISGLIASRITKKLMITFSSPVIGDNMEFQGAIVGSVSLEKLYEIMSSLNFGDTGELFVLDRKGKMVTKSRFSESFEPDVPMNSAIVTRAMYGMNDTAAYKSYRGETVFGAYQWSKSLQWVVVGEIAKKEVYSNLYRILYFIIGIVLVILIISYIAVIFLASRIERPILYLLQGTRIIQDGNYEYQIDSSKIKRSPIELKQLVDTFNVMSRKLKSTIGLLENLASIDQLTEIYNRRYIMNAGNKRLEACVRSGHPCSVIMVDIDYFKNINDTYGHLVGDRVLKHVAFLLSDQADSNVIVGRYGGEEFILLVSNSDSAQSQELAERLRRRIESKPYSAEQLTVYLTVSLGVAEYSENPEFGTNLLEDMVFRADNALYEAKRLGRNRVMASV